MAVEARERPGPAPRPTTRPRPRREREEELLVWPDLVFVEFIAAVLFLLTFIILSVFVNAPLLNEANTDITPNPSKAPWYFLNLQELLLHMDKAWAGVILPTMFLGFLITIPYMDRRTEAQGVWFGTRFAGRISGVTAFYSMAVTWLLVLFDAAKFERLTRFIPTCPPGDGHPFPPCFSEGDAGLGSTRQLQTRLRFSVGDLDWPQDFSFPVPFNNMPDDLLFKNLQLWQDMRINLAAVMTEQVIPLVTIAFLTVLIVYALFRIGWARNSRDVMLIMFTGAMAAYLTLTIVGSFFRGQGQELILPTDLQVDCGTLAAPPGCP